MGLMFKKEKNNMMSILEGRGVVDNNVGFFIGVFWFFFEKWE